MEHLLLGAFDWLIKALTVNQQSTLTVFTGIMHNLAHNSFTALLLLSASLDFCALSLPLCTLYFHHLFIFVISRNPRIMS